MTEVAMTGGAAANGADAVVAGVLEERTRALARPVHGEAGETVELVAVVVGGRRYGLDTGRVVGVEALVGLTRVPGLPAVWAGLMNVRGALHPVLDVSRYLSLPEPRGPGAPRGSGGLGTVVLVAGAGLAIGLLVDEALGIVRVASALIGARLLGTPAVAGGVTPDLLTVLDVEALLADTGLAVREESV